ncbi:putative transferase [Escherichia coli]|uniref:Putative transferase n=1 Tax=Escherichia coli TaxID=562 RepID=A0A377K350_ECOLX|nr:putative transferase [Escherichia coli]
MQFPRGGNAGGGGQPGWILKCKGWKPILTPIFISLFRSKNWENTCKAIGKPEWITDPAYSTAHARQPHIFDIFAEIEKYTVTIDKHEAVAYLTQFDIPCAPVLSMKEISLDPSLRQSGSVVEVETTVCVENI